MADPIIVGKSEEIIHLLPRMANRHGLIAGATGTGKTVTLQRLAHAFSDLGVPVFLADVKGDLSGISQPGGGNRKVTERLELLGMEANYAGTPVTFWDVLGEKGHPVRTTISDMGPLLLARLLNLNETQEGVLTIAFRVADENGWLLLDIKDLKSMLQFVAENAQELRSEYGNVSPASVGAIQRRLIQLEDQGAAQLFGEPALTLEDLMQTDAKGRGVVNVLAADKLINTPAVYSTFLLWLLAELFEQLREVGDPEKPRLVLFFDEAHLLFDDAPEALLDKVEQVVRLIRSKGVGVYFVTQSPLDIPESVLGQLGNRVQHALRAFTPKDQKAVRAAAQTFRPNPKLDTEQAIMEVKVGEALVSVLNADGSPGIVQRTLIAPPLSRLGPITDAERKKALSDSLVAGVYEKAVDRESAYEILAKRAEERAAEAAREAEEKAAEKERSRGNGRQSVLETLAKSVARTVGTQVGRQIVRGILGSLFGGRR
ncbi:MAG: DUF853 family protein [Chromatiales bacterium]|nr:DUF853 family protein [Chromatiales bacterium]